MIDVRSRPVVVGVDGSTSAGIAAAWAADEAVSRKVGLRIVYANMWPVVHPPGGHLPVEYHESMLRFANGLVRRAVESVTERHPDLPVTGDVVTSSPAELLLAESHKAQLVVLGSRGLGGFTGLLVGSVAVAVAAHGSCPLVVVRGRELDSPPPAEGPIVVGVTGSVLDTPALRFAFEIADRRGAALTAVHAWSDVPLDAPAGDWRRLMDWDAVHEDERRVLAERLAGWGSEFPDVKVTGLVTRDRPVRSLLDAARTGQLLVVGSRGRGGFTGMMLGSTSHALLHHSPCPVAVVREPLPNR